LEADVPKLPLTYALLVSVAAASPATTGPRGWPDTPIGRLEALAELETLDADLLSHDSATLTLDRWCATHHLAERAQIVADRVKGADKLPPADVRAQLQVAPDEAIAYRRVRLRCGDRVLSEADNWYLPSRLTPEMNRQLETSDVAFGRVVAPLHFQRHGVASQLLWSPLPDGWESGTAAPPKANPQATLAIPDHVIMNSALLTRADGRPFSYVVESYTGAVLDFPPSLAR
jgi:hypothetical protein